MKGSKETGIGQGDGLDPDEALYEVASRELATVKTELTLLHNILEQKDKELNLVKAAKTKFLDLMSREQETNVSKITDGLRDELKAGFIFEPFHARKEQAFSLPFLASTGPRVEFAISRIHFPGNWKSKKFPENSRDMPLNFFCPNKYLAKAGIHGNSREQTLDTGAQYDF